MRLSRSAKLGWVGVALLVGGCASPTQRLDSLLDDYFEDRLRESPTWATYIGDHRYDDRLEDVSLAAHERSVERLESWRRRVAGIDPASLPPSRRLSREIFERLICDQIDHATCGGSLAPITHQNGPHISMPLILLSQPFETAQDYGRYVARLRAFPTQVEQLIECMREGMRVGHVLPRIIAEAILPQLESQIVDDPEASTFCDAIDRIPDDIPAERREGIAADVRDAVADAIVPGYRQLHAFVRDEYLPACREMVGIWAVPDGDRIYDLLARYHTTTDMTPEEIHQVGLAELGRIHVAMNGIRVKVGFEGTLPEFFEHLRTSPEHLAASAQSLLDGFSAIMDRTQPELPRLFGKLPQAPCEVREMEAFRAPSAPAAYAYPPPRDGSRPGYFYVNTYRATERPTYTMEALTYHEALPGHHLQLALDQENESLPRFRRYTDFTAYIEGWALYAESLGYELGGYADPYAEFGRLTFDAWRAARLVVDTGLHRMKWSRQQAIEFMADSTALTRVDLESEVDRYIAWPGQALGYKIGELTIQRLRREAEDRLGDRFDVRAFHDALLAEGCMPLSVLERRMQRWIEEQSKAL